MIRRSQMNNLLHNFSLRKNLFPIVLFSLIAFNGFEFSQAQKNKIHVQVIGTQKNIVPISSLTREGIVYAAVDELAQALSFKTFYDNIKNKIELILPTARLKLTANNPFIVVADKKGSSISEVFQMPREVVQTTNSFYAPIASFIPLLRRIWNHEISFNQKVFSLTVSAKEGLPQKTVGEKAAMNSTASQITSVKYDITHLTVEKRMNGTLIRIHSNKKLNRFESSLADDGKLHLLISDVTADLTEIEQTPSSGEIKKIIAKQDGAKVKLQFELNTDVESSDVTKDVQSNDLLISLFHKASVDSIYSAEIQSKKKQLDQKKARWKLDVIVIDAGHGGKDPGTIGVSGIKEKNIALGIALKLGRLIENKVKNVRVVFTRKSDTFVELDRRGQIANEEMGKLFLSIHCNSTEKKPSTAKGLEVYLLRPGKTSEAIRIAEVENSVIKLEKDYEKRYAKLTNENFILINMAQSSYMKYSERFAELLHQEVQSEKILGSNSVKQAGFLVLVGASMPSVLIETGFLSNNKEEKTLASSDGQQRIANMIFEAVERYAKEYDKSLKE